MTLGGFGPVEVCAACPRRRGCRRALVGEAAVDSVACHWETAADPSGGPRSFHSRARHRLPPCHTPCYPRAPFSSLLAPVLGRLTKKKDLQNSRLSAIAAEIQHQTEYAETIAARRHTADGPLIRQTALPSYLSCPVPAFPPRLLKPKKSSAVTRKSARSGPAQAARQGPLVHTCHYKRKRVAARLQDATSS